MPEALPPGNHPATKLREGHIFTSVCMFTGAVGMPGPMSLAGDGYTRGVVYLLGGYTRGVGVPQVGMPERVHI